MCTVLFSLIELLDYHGWTQILQLDKLCEDGWCCNCTLCSDLRLFHVYDFVHELFNMCLLMHVCPPYPMCSTSIQIQSLNLNNNQSWIQMLHHISNSELNLIQFLVENVLEVFCMGSRTEIKVGWWFSQTSLIKFLIYCIN